MKPRYASWPLRLKAAARWVWGSVAIAVAGTFVGCDGDIAGTCDHVYREPLLQIVAARDAQDGTLIPSVVVQNVRRDGIEQDLRSLIDGPSYGVEIQGDSLICRVPCAFATQEGNYIFTVSATGYPPQDRGYEARYRVFKGGCPSYNEGGISIRLGLRRAVDALRLHPEPHSQQASPTIPLGARHVSRVVGPLADHAQREVDSVARNPAEPRFHGSGLLDDSG